MRLSKEQLDSMRNTAPLLVAEVEKLSLYLEQSAIARVALSEELTKVKAELDATRVQLATTGKALARQCKDQTRIEGQLATRTKSRDDALRELEKLRKSKADTVALGDALRRINELETELANWRLNARMLDAELGRVNGTH